jgi:hypothetical protein
MWPDYRKYNFGHHKAHLGHHKSTLMHIQWQYWRFYSDVQPVLHKVLEYLI